MRPPGLELHAEQASKSAVRPMTMRLDPWLDQKNDFLTVEVSNLDVKVK